MTLAEGQTLAHYRILGPLGAGGMGEVYRARDTRLDRDVAIKILPHEFVEDEDRLRRFEREAKVLAALSHPNIDAIHGIDQEGETCYLVLELVPGEGLDERISRGRLSAEETIDVGTQIATGLEAAHEAGIVHRDLKPANVRITPEGIVKVLDFGLAKSAESGTTTGTTAKKDSFLLTAEGMVLGTPTYMSPEQARGRPVDRRTDVWALGCVLFECLTGRRAFPGSDLLDVLAAVREEEPDWNALPRGTPPHVEHVIRRCLVKDPRTRLRDIGEARLLLGGEVEAPKSGVPNSAVQRASVLPWLLIPIVSLLVALAVWAWSRPLAMVQPAFHPRAVTKFTIEFPVEERTVYDGVSNLSVSPDGRTIAITALIGGKGGIYLRDLDSIEARLVPTTEGARSVCWSPDGLWLAYQDRDVGELRRLRVEGGAPITVALSDDMNGLSWSPGGKLALAMEWGAPLVAISVEGATNEPLTRLEPASGDRHHLLPHFLPGGKAMLFAIWTGRNWDEARIAVQDLKAGERTVLPVRGTSPTYVPLGDGETGALLWVRAAELWARRFDPRNFELIGDGVRMLDGVRLSVGSGDGKYHVSPNGTLAYVPGGVFLEESRFLWVARDGTEQPAFEEVGAYQSPSLSRNGERIAYVRMGPIFHIETLDLAKPLASRRPRRLTFEGDSYQCSVSPDGETVVFISNHPTGEYHTYAQPFDGSSPPVKILENDIFPRSWTPDGEWLLYSFGGDLWRVPMDDLERGVRAPAKFASTGRNEYDPQASPDGRWVAYGAVDERGKNNVFVTSHPDGKRRLQVTRDGAGYPRWSPDGNELYYKQEDKLFAVALETEPVLSFGTPELLFEAHYAGDYGYSKDYGVAPDGRFLVVEPVLAEEDYLRVVVVENFLAELEAKLPPAE